MKKININKNSKFQIVEIKDCINLSKIYVINIDNVRLEGYEWDDINGARIAIIQIKKNNGILKKEYIIEDYD